MTATLAVPESHTFMQVTMAVMNPAAPVPEPRQALDVTGEVIATRPWAPPPLSRRADADLLRPPAASVVARYLASVEPRDARSRCSVYA